MKWIDSISLNVWIIIALTFGLAPFLPQPHVWEKLNMLSAGTLHKPIDILDLILHGAPWVMVGLKLLRLGLLRRID